MTKRKFPDDYEKVVGFIQVSGFKSPDTPGLFIHRYWHNKDSKIEPPPYRWGVSHLQSGLSIGSFKKRKSAFKMAKEVKKIWKDWEMEMSYNFFRARPAVAKKMTTLLKTIREEE